MNAVPMNIIERAIYCVLTLYMMAVLLRWFSPHLELDANSSRWSWVRTIVDPVVRPVRRALPQTGPVDLAPAATILLVWLIRQLILAITANVH